MQPPTLSIVVPACNEEETLPELFRRIEAAFRGTDTDYEVIVVDDGSRDGTLAALREAARTDPRIRGLSLSRNFGHQMAVSAGLSHARGRAVAVMDADLQDPPEVLSEMLRLWRAGHDVVYGVRRRRKEGFILRAGYHLFYRILARLASIRIPLDSGDFCLMDRRVVDHLNAMPERNRFIRGLRAWIGLSQVGLEYERDPRYAGRTKYSFRRLAHLAADGIVTFSVRPLRYAMKLGFLMAGTSLVVALVYLVLWIVGGRTWPRGFASLFIAILFLFGIQFMLIGILGEYVGRIHTEVQGRPPWLVNRRVGFPDAPEDASRPSPPKGD